MRILIIPQRVQKGRMKVSARKKFFSLHKRLTAAALAMLMAMSAGVGALAADEPATNAGFENGPYLLAPKANSMVVAFEGKTGDAAKIYYGTSTDNMQELSIDSQDGPAFEGEKMHIYRAKLENLTPDTLYQYRIELKDGSVENGTFKTLSENPDDIHFMVVSDTHKFETAQEVSDYIMANRPDFILHTGDMVEGTGTQKDQFNFWFKNGTEFIKNVPVIYNCGNHDYGEYFDAYVTEVQQQEYHSNTDGTNISFNYGNAHFTMMNSNPWSLFELNTDSAGGSASAETHANVEKSLEWLQNDLQSDEAQNADFRVLTMHHPYEDSYTRKYIPPIAEKYNVNVMFAGHTHAYSRIASADPAVGTGTLYVTQGDARVGDGKVSTGSDDERLDENLPELLANGKGDMLDVHIKDGVLTYTNLGLSGSGETEIETVALAQNGADVQLSDIAITPDSVQSSGAVTVTATATNTGKGLAVISLPVNDNGTTRYLYHFGKYGKERVVALQPGESKTVSAELTLTDLGKHTLKLGDYTKVVDVTYRPATYSASNLRVKLGDGETSDINSDVLYVKADVTNIGNDAGNLPVAFVMDGSSLAEQQVALAAGETKTVEFVYQFDTYGDHEVAIGNSDPKKVTIAGTIQGTPIVKDKSGKGNDGIIRGKPTLITYGENNEYGLKLDGVYDYVEIPDRQNYVVDDGVTGMVWANIGRLAKGDSTDWDHNPLMMKGSTINYGTNYLFRMAVRSTGKLTYGVGFDNDNGEYFWNDSDGKNASGAEYGAQLNEWVQYTGSFDRATGGASYQNTEVSGTIAAPAFDSPIKNWPGCSMYVGGTYTRHLLPDRNRGKYHCMLQGEVGQVRFYTTKLSDADNKAVYANPTAAGPKADKMVVWLDFNPKNIVTTGTHQTEWVSVGALQELQYDALVEGKAGLSVNVELSQDGKNVSSSKQYTLANGTNTLDLSELGEAKFVRLTTTFDSAVGTDRTDLPKVMEYTLKGAEQSAKWSTIADWNRGTFSGAAGHENMDFYNGYENDFDDYSAKADMSMTVEASGEDVRPSQKFTDTRTHWAADAVDYVVENNLFNGTSETQFSPDAEMTRGMLVTVLHRQAKEPAGAASTFADVPANRYDAKAIGWAAENAIVDGVSENLFAPDLAVTREEMAAILYRYAKTQGSSGEVSEDKLDGYPDASVVSDWARDAVAWCIGEGLISGSDGGAIDPAGTATRAEVATIMMRYQNK